MKTHSPMLQVLRKDLRLFWQFAALNAALIVLGQFPTLVAHLGPVGALVKIAIPLANILFILVLFYEDAVVSLKHDWLTRPVSGLHLLGAKVALVLLTIFVPAILGGSANALYLGRSLDEALLTGVSTGTDGGTLMLNLFVMAFAAATGSIRQAIIVFLAGTIGMALLAAVFIGLSGASEAIVVTGSTWVVSRSIELLLALVALSVLWVQYRHRHTRAAWYIVGAGLIVGATLVASLPWPRIHAIQKSLSPEPAARTDVEVALADGCFAARVLDAQPDRSAGSALDITPERYPQGQRESAGPGAIAFATRLRQIHVPAGQRLLVAQVELTLRGADGREQSLSPGLATADWKPATGALVADHYWLLPRDRYAGLGAQGVTTRIQYALSLLVPQASAEFAADGRRAFHPGIGYCSASFERATGVVDVDCFKAGPQPAQLVANLAGAPQHQGVASGYANFVPAGLDFWGGESHKMRLRTTAAEVPRVTVTAFEARVHLDRQFVVAGALGGLPAACPPPAAAP